MFNKDTGKYEGFIYCIFNMFNQKRYIGQTTRTIDIRIKEHKKRVNENRMESPILYEDMKNYGFDIFDVYEVEKIVADTLSELRGKLNEKEIYYISYMNTMIPNGYNVLRGGHEISDEVKIYQFDERGNMICEYQSIHDVALKTDVDTNSVLRSCRENKSMAGGYYWCFSPTIPEEYLHSRRVKTKTAMYDLHGNFVKVFDSIRDAADEIAGSTSKWKSIQKCMKREKSYKTAYGYIWRYAKDVTDNLGNIVKTLPESEVIEANTNNRHKYKGKKVCQFLLDGTYVNTYNTITEASKSSNIHRCAIGQCLNNGKNVAGGYMWKYFNDIKDQEKNDM